MTEDYDLGKSSKKLGKLYPILKDHFGNVIDGFHRQNSDPTWPTEMRDEIDTPVKLELARLAANFCRRTMPASEMESKIKFLVKNGLTAEQIAEETGVSVATIYRHMPQELKEPSKVEAGKVSGSVRTCEQTVTTQDMIPSEHFHCEMCGLDKPLEQKTLFGGKELHAVCKPCRTRYGEDKLGVRFQSQQRELERKVPEVPKYLDSYANRLGNMKVQHSKMELKIVDLARKKGYKVTTGIKIVVKEIWTEPDFNIELVSGKIVHIYIDGVVHNGKKRDKDDALRDLLRMKEPGSVVEVDVKGDSDKEAEAKLSEIEEAMLF